MILIKSKTDGFRRCGVAHSSEGKSFPDDYFTEEQIEIMEKDPDLMVTLLPDLPETDPEEEAQARKLLEKMKVDQLKKECDVIQIAYPKDARKDDLIDLLLKNTAPVPEA